MLRKHWSIYIQFVSGNLKYRPKGIRLKKQKLNEETSNRPEWIINCCLNTTWEHRLSAGYWELYSQNQLITYTFNWNSIYVKIILYIHISFIYLAHSARVMINIPSILQLWSIMTFKSKWISCLPVPFAQGMLRLGCISTRKLKMHDLRDCRSFEFRCFLSPRQLVVYRVCALPRLHGHTGKVQKDTGYYTERH